MHTAAKLCLLAAAPLLAAAQHFEWAGVFSLDGAVSPSKWSMQAADATDAGTYPDQTMKIVIIPTTTPDAATLKSLESNANALVAGTCTAVADTTSMTPAADGSCFTLTVGSGVDSEFDIVTTGLTLTGVAVFAEHVPIEFERDRHYFYDSATTPMDIEPIAENAAFEWSGVFPLDGATSPSEWHMQANANGVYPDQSMIVVLIRATTEDVATVTAAEAAMVAHTTDAAGLLGLFGTSCPDKADGDSMTVPNSGACYTLKVGSGDDTTFKIVTTDLAGITVFAQHIPIEFERDRHYFNDKDGADLEPFAESEHDVAHAHGETGPSPSADPAASGASIATAVATIVAAGGAAALL
jgi:hypothetical protein